MYTSNEASAKHEKFNDFGDTQDTSNEESVTLKMQSGT